ncbi:MAG: 50S ribosomal protein L25/general stress protein Ctc, partial [Alphaproteobacteria bacterium]|nr:50S ribosomal protein L25/general stress protein Ctc [Alphaproteobacteria bacterium]
MAETVTLEASPRTGRGKGGARAARRDGTVPAIIYGKDVAPILMTLPRKELEREIGREGFFIRMIDVTLDGRTMKVLPRDVQYDPVTDVPVHVDFVHYAADREISVAVPVRFAKQDASPGLKLGGVLNIVRHTVEVRCSPGMIPDSFTVDLSGLQIGDSIHSGKISLPSGVRFAGADRDFTIVSIAAPTREETARPAEAAAGEAAA